MSARREARRLAIAARKAAAKERLRAPVTPPTEPVALPWRRRPSKVKARKQRRAEEGAWSMVMSGDADDVEGALAAAAVMSGAVAGMLRRER